MSHRDLLWCRPVAAFDLLQYTRTRGLSIVDLPLSLTWICPYITYIVGNNERMFQQALNFDNLNSLQCKLQERQAEAQRSNEGAIAV